MEYRVPFRSYKNEVLKAEKGGSRIPVDSTPVSKLLFEAVEKLDEIERLYMRETVARAAGYIAARSNLWVVTDSVELKDELRILGPKVNVAKLVGLGVNESDRVIPVVTGKNQKVSKLSQPEKLRTVEGGTFRTLTVIQSQKVPAKL